MSRRVPPDGLDPLVSGGPDGYYVVQKSGTRFREWYRLAAGANVTLTPDAVNHELAVSASVSGGGGSAWTKIYDLPLTTLTGWTAGAGSWSAAAGGIRQATTANGVYRLHNNTRIPLGEVIAEMEVKLDVTPNNVSSRGGFVFGTPAAADGTGGDEVSLISKGSTTQVTAVDFESDAITNWGQVNLAANITNGTWITYRVHKVGLFYTIWINGVLLTTFRIGIVQGGSGPIGREFGRFALYSYASDVSYRNLKVWIPTLP